MVRLYVKVKDFIDGTSGPDRLETERDILKFLSGGDVELMYELATQGDNAYGRFIAVDAARHYGLNEFADRIEGKNYNDEIAVKNILLTQRGKYRGDYAGPAFALAYEQLIDRTILLLDMGLLDSISWG